MPAAEIGSSIGDEEAFDSKLADDDKFIDVFVAMLGRLEEKLHKAVMRGGGVKGDRQVIRLQSELQKVGLFSCSRRCRGGVSVFIFPVPPTLLPH